MAVCLNLNLLLLTNQTMKKHLLLQTVFLLSSSFITFSFGQSADYLQRAYQHIASKYNLDRNQIGELRIKSQYSSAHNRVEHVYLVQTYKDVDILGTGINLAFQPNGQIISIGHHLKGLDKFPVTQRQARLSAAEAIVQAANSLGQDTRSLPAFKRTSSKGVPVYDKSNISLQDIPVELGYMQTPTGEFRLVYSMSIESASRGSLYQSYVDAVTGETVANDALTLNCKFDEGYLAAEHTCTDVHEAMPAPSAPPVSGSGGTYRVLPATIESPSHGSFALVTDADDMVASPFGWHDSDGLPGVDHIDTRGNNVHAFLDRNWDYFPDLVVSGGDDLIFDFPYNDIAEPIGNQQVAVTNLFFQNNIMHDFAYHYGFDEVAGNFQETNYTGEGQEGDYVEAHAQFGDDNYLQCGNETGVTDGCVNNAYFSPPSDGFNGRMVMYTWNRDNSSKFLDVIEPADLSGKILTGLPQFGTDITTEAVTGQVIEINDGSFDPLKGCNPVTQPELAGKIALIDRGVCDFSLKVYNAQEAGAIGAIICNFEDATIPMGPGENAEDVIIPSVFISSVECNRIRIAIGSGLVVSLVSPGASGPALRDGSLDNSVISHEYGHGISTRLTGGPANSNCLSPNAIIGDAEESHGMGEGWSDFFALATTARQGDTGAKRRGIGTYANKEPTNGRGIRTYPYSTDMTVNPHTYDNVLLEALPHGVGSVWCAMIWDMYWAFTDTYGWDPDLYTGTGGNNMAIQLVMDGLKLQPCNPGFIDARDAILAADVINFDGANQCLIWNVFARRGLGVNADGGDPDSRSDGKEGFEVPTSCLDELTFSKTMTPEVVAGDIIEVTLTVNNYKDFALTNVAIEDLIPDGCFYLLGSANIEPASGNSLVWTINSIAPDEEVIITYLLRTDQTKNSVRLQYDDIEGLADDRWDINFDPNGTLDNFWTQQDTIVRSGEAAYRVGDVATESQHYLQNNTPFTVEGDYPVYRFYTYYNTEAGADAGFLEISTNEEPAWRPLQDEIFRNSYPRKVQYTTFAIPNLGAFSGLSSTTKEMQAVYIDLSEYADQDVTIRYRFGTDANTAGDGWYIDDIELMDAILYNAEACITSDQTSAICAEAPSRGTIVDSQITISTEDEDNARTFAIMPNPAGEHLQIVMSAEKPADAVVSVFNMTGHLLARENWGLAAGSNQKTMSMSGYAPGMYVIQVKTGEAMRSEKFIKE
jgi:extracellular elastinolytic metalloproteinase